VEIEEAGESFDQDDVFGTIEAVKTVSELFSPIDVEITELNEELEDNPELVNEDCYADGWLVKVKIVDASQLDDLMDAEAYKKIVA
jgi:glycine cleavage system H protein